MLSRYLEQGLGVKTQDGDTKLVLTLVTLGDNLAPELTHSNLDHSALQN